MFIQCLLLLCFFSEHHAAVVIPETDYDGFDDLILDNQYSYTAVEGGNFTAKCSFRSGTKQIFCRNNCDKENVLVSTTESSRRKGRYSIEYKKEPSSRHYEMSVSITNVTRADSGEYLCFTKNPSGFKRFTIDVKEAHLPEAVTPSNRRSGRETPSPPEPLDVSLSTAPQDTLALTPVSDVFRSVEPSSKQTTELGYLWMLIPIVMATGLIFYIIRISKKEKSRCADTEMVVYENAWPPDEDHTYTSLSRATLDHNIYMSLTETQCDL